MASPPVKIANIAIGDGTIASGVVWNLVPTVSCLSKLTCIVNDGSHGQLSVIETFPQLIGYDPQVYQYFKEQHVLFISPP